MTYRIVAIALISVLTACSDRTQTANSNDSTSPADTIERTTESIHVAAVEHTERGATDKERDAGRKPAEVLEFFGIAQGMDVLDMFSGGGYYTEVLSRVVGSEGSVIAHTNQAYAGFVGEEATIRYANNRLPNVEILMAENNAFEFPDGAFDAVLMILAYHDIYYVSPNDGWPKIDGPKLLDAIFISLRPGGILAIVDHYAAAGSAPETGNTLHRIDPEIVIAEIKAAGFVLNGKSEVLRNMDDNHSLNMAAPEVRGKTDRFVLRFKKPN